MATTNIKKVLQDIEKKAKKMSWPIIGPEHGKILEKLIGERKPKRILEIGSLVGYSSILMSQYLPKSAKITTIEINPKFALLAQKNFKKAGVESLIEIITGDAMKVMPKLQDNFDMLFLDAAKDECYNYILLAENKLSPRVVVVADNVKIFENDMQDYLDYVRNSGKYESEKFDFGADAMEVSFKKN